MENWNKKHTLRLCLDSEKIEKNFTHTDKIERKQKIIKAIKFNKRLKNSNKENGNKL